MTIGTAVAIAAAAEPFAEAAIKAILDAVANAGGDPKAVIARVTTQLDAEDKAAKAAQDAAPAREQAEHDGHSRR